MLRRLQYTRWRYGGFLARGFTASWLYDLGVAVSVCAHVLLTRWFWSADDLARELLAAEIRWKETSTYFFHHVVCRCP